MSFVFRVASESSKFTSMFAPNTTLSAIKQSFPGQTLHFLDKDEKIRVSTEAELDGVIHYAIQVLKLNEVRITASMNTAKPSGGNALLQDPDVARLVEMGFVDPAANRAALLATNGSVTKAAALMRSHVAISSPNPRRTHHHRGNVSHHDMLGRLLDLGFCNMQQNLLAAKRNNYDLERTVAALLESNPSCIGDKGRVCNLHAGSHQQ